MGGKTKEATCKTQLLYSVCSLYAPIHSRKPHCGVLQCNIMYSWKIRNVCFLCAYNSRERYIENGKFFN